MKIREIKIHGIKSHVDTTITTPDYTVFVGENNSGKSNILFAFLWFFGKEKISSKDLNSSVKDDPYVEVEFEVKEDEEFSHPAEYLVDKKFRVRATISKSKVLEKAVACEYFGYTGNTEDTIKDTKLLGWKTVAKPSFGDVIYIPSVRPLSEELKFTANSSLNQLVTKNIITRIKIEDEKNQYYSKVIDSITGLSIFISEGEGSAIQKLKTDISNKMLDYGKVKIGFDLVPPDADDLIKSCFRPHTSIDGTDDKLPLSSQGDGFQRSMMFSLISNLAELNKEDQKSSKKTAKNDCTFYIIEEPELFLHPNHQTYFRNKLEEISVTADSQVIITSHSPYFLNNVEDFSQIKRVYADDTISKVAIVTEKDVEDICLENGKLMALAKNECRNPKLSKDDLEIESGTISKTDHLRYLLWIDPTRANAFLSQKVILVEGPTEKAFFSFLFNNPKGTFYNESHTAKITIVDTVGKYHFYKFAKLLAKFGIKVWCIHDGDNDACSNGISHKYLNEIIEKMKTDGTIIDFLRLDPDLEQSIGVAKGVNADIEMYVNLEQNTNKCTESVNYLKIVEFVKKIIEA
ncbi:MAG: AAA family ATPase [Candidatus Paceibacterota bacterium]